MIFLRPSPQVGKHVELHHRSLACKMYLKRVEIKRQKVTSKDLNISIIITILIIF